MPPWIEISWDLFKVVAPWLTGGLAGAILTYLLNQRIARRRQARIVLTSERVDYSLATRDEQLKQLRVSYRGKEFDNLLLYQLAIENTSTKTIAKSPLLLRFAAGTTIVDRNSLTHPLNRDTSFVQQVGHESAYLWDAGELKPGDSAKLTLLLTPTTPVEWNWRGDDEVDVTAYGRAAPQTVEREIGNVIIWVSLYVLLGSIPLLSGFAHALMLVISAPFIVSFWRRWWPLITSRESPSINVTAADDANVAVVVGPGQATVPRQKSGVV